jgi:magnesium-transporting ATPase (P-type)
LKTQERPEHAQPSVEEAARADLELLFSRLAASPAGLTRHEAAARIARFGPNTVARERPLAPLRRLLQLFLSPLSLLLLGLAFAAQLTGEPRGALVIAVMVVLSVLLSWFQEVRSGKAAERLRAMVHTTATVLRRERGKTTAKKPVVGASAFLPFLPMAPVQVLLNNLLYDFSQTALATDSVDAAYVAQPRKWDIGNIGRYMLVFGPISSLFDYATFFTLLYALQARDNPSLFQSGWFVESVLSQTLIVHVIRTAGVPFRDSRPSAPLLATTVAVCAAALWLPFSQFAPLLGLTPLPPAYWIALAAILVCYMLLTQSVKAALVRRFGLD